MLDPDGVDFERLALEYLLDFLLFVTVVSVDLKPYPQ